MKIVLMLLAAVLLPLVILYSLSRPGKDVPLEWELAVVNAGSEVPLEHPSVLEFRDLLDRLDEKCINSRREIVEVCIAAYYYRKERGDLDTLMEFTTRVERSTPGGPAGQTDIKEVVRDMLMP